MDMLENLIIIDASTVLAGPSVGTFFAELGANVIKVENPNIPDVTRSWKLANENQESSISAYFSSVNYLKKEKSIDLKNSDGHAAFLDLIKEADILISNFKHGDEAKLGIQDETLHYINPRLIIGKINGFGEESDRVAYDLILQAETGFMSMNGTPESGPVKIPVALIDVLAGHQLKEAILLALLERKTTGQGRTVSVSLYDAAVCSLMNQASNYLMAGKIPERLGSAHPNISPYGELFTTKDGDIVTFAVGSNAHFVKLCQFLQLDELANDKRFAENIHRVKNREALREIIEERVKLRHTEDILQKLIAANVPVAKVRNLQEVFTDEAAKALIRVEEQAGINTKRVSSIAFKWH
jgi:crotonobetainyl-CoA:carnitine CoA-transferase CaiB-like acyl-CoA transferase